MHAGVIKQLTDSPRSPLTVLVWLPGYLALIPPSQEEIDAPDARQEAETIDAPQLPNPTWRERNG
jgi:hypothetical protein